MTNVHSGNQHARQEVAGSNRRRPGLFFFFAVLLIAALLTLLIGPLSKRARFQATLMEMKQIDPALKNYEKELGSPPLGCELSEIQRHVKDVRLRIFSTREIEPLLPYSVSELDTRELLPLWLGGMAWDSILRNPHSGHDFYEFVESRLVDEDGDGWLEYIDER